MRGNVERSNRSLSTVGHQNDANDLLSALCFFQKLVQRETNRGPFSVRFGFQASEFSGAKLRIEIEVSNFEIFAELFQLIPARFKGADQRFPTSLASRTIGSCHAATFVAENVQDGVSSVRFRILNFGTKHRKDE